jgi:hypothetical protein
MTADAFVVLGTIVFFAMALGYVRICERLGVRQ